MKLILLACLPVVLFGQPDAQSIIDKSIKVHGGKRYLKKSFQFEFRDKSYSYENDGNNYLYTRAFTKDDQHIEDKLSNSSFERTINNQPTRLSTKQSTSYSNSVNSVIYFAMLPHFLNDPAVNKKYLGKTRIKDQQYHKIQVSFDQDGGGTDHDDIYIYWINSMSYHLDYLAYSFHVNGGGVRFRSAYNRRIIDGITFQDYINYKGDKNIPPEQMDELFSQQKLKELSRIELKNIRSF